MLESVSALLGAALGRQVARPGLQDEAHAARLEAGAAPRRSTGRVAGAAGLTGQAGQARQTGAARRRLADGGRSQHSPRQSTHQ